LPAFEGDGTAALRVGYLDQIITDVLVRRLDSDVSSGTAPFDGIVPGTNSLVASLDAPALYAFSDPPRARDTLVAFLDEYERAARHGFSDAEVATAMSTLIASLDAELAGSDSIPDADYADRFVQHYLYGTPYPDIDEVHERFTAIVEAITPDAVAARYRARWENTAPHVIISTPSAAAGTMPTEADVVAAIAALPERALEPRAAGRELPDELMAPPAPVEPESIGEMLDTDDPFLDPVEIVFPNGARVIATSNDIVEGQVTFQASSPGGSSLVDDGDAIDALFAPGVVFDSGVGAFNQSELEQILADRDVQAGGWITPYTENLWGSAGTDDLETLFQLVHLYMTQPRVDPVSLANLMRYQQPIVDDPATDPDTAGYDALVDARYADEPRYTSLPTPEQFATLDAEGIGRVWNARYGNAGDFVFVFAGDLDLDVVADLARSYIGTLPGTPGAEAWVDVEQPPPAGVVRRQVEAGTGNTSSLTMLFTTPVAAVDGTLRANLDIATEVLNTRLTDVVRERLGESYSPSAFIQIVNDPEPTVETYVTVTGAPDRITVVGELVVAEIAALAADGPTTREFDLSFAQVAEAYEFVDNDTFVQELITDAVWPNRSLDEYFDEFGALESVTAASVQSVIARQIPAAQHIEIAVVPRP
jgi:zinc protease